jgi:ribosomal protein S18 acetylase RimI-like enzyme
MTLAHVPALDDLYDGLGERSVRLRFLSHRVPAGITKTIAQNLGSGAQVGVVATTPAGKIAGEAFCVDEGGGTSEMGITVADEFQEARLGTRLLEELARRAQVAGVDTFRAEVAADNTRCHALLKRHHFTAAGRAGTSMFFKAKVAEVLNPKPKSEL